jgi:hypothetical protein
MTDTSAKLKGRELATLGVTPDLAKEMYAHKGKHYMVIAEVAVDARHDAKAKVVDLAVESLEVATTDEVVDYLRNLANTIYQNRGVTEAQQALDDSLTPSLADALAAGQQHVAHPVLPDDAAKDNPLCEVCARVQADPLHADRAALDDPFEPGATEDLADTEQEDAPVPA